MNNVIRAALVRLFYKGAILRRLGHWLDGMRVLEIGCGSGVMTQIILDLGAEEVHASQS